jgi:predicted Zn-dependent peptidase
MKWSGIFLVVPLGLSLAAAQTPAAANVSEFEVNGLKVILKQRPGSETVAAGMFVRGGSSALSPAQAGLELLLLETSTEGSQRFPRAVLESELSSTSTTLSSGANYDYSALSLACTRANFNRAWGVFTDVLLHPALLPADVERVKSRMIAAAKSRDDAPDDTLEDAVSNTIYAGHPYAANPQGTASSLARVTVADLRAWHEKIMQTSRLLLVIVGDLDVYSVREKVNAAFGRLPRGDYHPAAVPLLKFAAASVHIVPHSVSTNYVEGVYAAPSFDSPDWPALNVASHILRDRVYAEVRIKRALSYAPSAFLNERRAGNGGIYVTTNNVNLAVPLMLKEIANLKNEPVSADDVSGAIAQFSTNYFLANQTNAAQAGMLAEYEIIGGGWRNAQSTMERSRKVTPADVQRVTRQYMNRLQFTVVGTENSFDKAVLTAAP